MPVVTSVVSLLVGGCAAPPRPVPPAPPPAAVPAVAPRDPRVGDPLHALTPAEKVQRTLDGTWAFPPAPAVTWHAQADGFAAERLFTVPPVGVHPRIVFGPEDVPRVRARVAASAAGTAMVAALRASLAQGIGTPTTWEGQCWTALRAGDVAGFAAVYRTTGQDHVPSGTASRPGPGHLPATVWGKRPPLLASMMYQALVALLDNDARAGADVAKAWATYAAWVAPAVAAARVGPQAAFSVEWLRDLVPQEVAYGYDWAWVFMTPEQRTALQQVIIQATAGTYTIGMDLPPHWRRSSIVGLSEAYAVGHLATEGEPGADPRGLERIYEVYRDYLTYGIDARGFGTESTGAQALALGQLMAPLIGFANRGKNLLVHPHLRALVEHGLVEHLQPFGGAWQSGGDLGNTPPSAGFVGPLAYFYPQVPAVAWVWQQHPQARTHAWDAMVREGNPVVLLCGEDPAAGDLRAAATAGRPLTCADAAHGVLVTRTGWGHEDAVLRVECRVDTTSVGHDHADRGNFTFSALGRAWACDGARETDGVYHNLVSIDGRGQGAGTPPGAWVTTVANEYATVAVTDARYAWTWQWAKSLLLESRASLTARHQEWAIDLAERLQRRVPLERWEADPSPVVRAYYDGFCAVGDPRMGLNEDSWVLRAPHVPVQRAFRTIGLVRGIHPYVMVIDDLQQDDRAHLYEWRMQAGPDVAAVAITAHDILLGDATTARAPDGADADGAGLRPATGDRLLLVRALERSDEDPAGVPGMPQVATIAYHTSEDRRGVARRQVGMGTQVIMPSYARTPNFKILLVPHRHGEELPTTTWNDQRTQMTLAWKDQHDVWAFARQADGRTTVVASRQGVPFIAVP